MEAPVAGSKGREGSAATRSNTVRFGLVTPEMVSEVRCACEARNQLNMEHSKTSIRDFNLKKYTSYFDYCTLPKLMCFTVPEYISASHDSSPTLTVVLRCFEKIPPENQGTGTHQRHQDLRCWAWSWWKVSRTWP